MNIKKIYVLIFSLILLANKLSGQSIRVENLKDQFNWKNAAKINGGFSANAIYYNGNNASRDPFTWMLNANVNVNLFGLINIPMSYTLSNLTKGFTYPTPPNRLSLHPSYKWITAHIGDAAMTFSPYTLSGIQFSGGGIELTPTFVPLTLSAMIGTIVKASEYDPEKLDNIPTYKRSGVGTKVEYKSDKINLGWNIFSAKDDKKSLLMPIPRAMNIFPEENIAMSWNTSINMIKNLSLTAEYGLSILEKETFLNEPEQEILTTNNLQTTYHAFNVNLNYQWLKNAFGVGYERIDPEYRTLGGYFFNNDFENFTFNYARPFLNDKITLATNVGLQQNDLKNRENEKTQRIVGAINLGYAINKNLSTSVAYSNFQSFTNKKNQFDYINQVSQYDNIDTLNFQQLSQNANANINYAFSRHENRKNNINVNFNFQEASSKEAGRLNENALTKNYNFTSNYALTFLKSMTQLSASFNVSYSDLASSSTWIMGPSIGLNTKFMDKKMSNALIVSYNSSTNNNQKQNEIFTIRLNTSYTFLKKNIFTISILEQLRKTPQKGTQNDFTVTLNYSYSF